MPGSTSAAVLEAMPLAALSLSRRKSSGITRPYWQPLPHQTPPEGDWDVWMLLGGRGSGKTRAGAEYVLEHLDRLGSQARVAVGAPTIADARNTCAEGPSGLINIARSLFPTYNRSMGEASHWKGGYVKFLGSEEPGRWNGPQWTLLWADELALWNEESWDQAQFGLRLGADPRALVTTTPKARLFVRKLSLEPGTAVTRAKTVDNPHLSQRAVQRLVERYGGTRLGRQELDAEFLDDVPGALWTRGMLDLNRVAGHPDLARVVIAVDPSGGHGEDNDEQGIVAAGRGVDARGYVLDDRTCKLSPDGWGRRVVQAYLDFNADRVVYEKNFGGEMVEMVIRTAAAAMGVEVATKAVHASRGKAVRAEPIAALDEQGRVSHVGSFPQLEDELCTWTPESGVSPNRLDARVWALTDLLLEPEQRWGAV